MVEPTYSPDPTIARQQREVDAEIAQLDDVIRGTSEMDAATLLHAAKVMRDKKFLVGPGARRIFWLREIRNQHPDLVLVKVPR